MANVHRSLEKIRGKVDLPLSAYEDLWDYAEGLVAFTRGAEHRYEIMNAAYANAIGNRDAIGKSVREVFLDVSGQDYFALLDRCFATGQACVVNSVEIRLPHAADQSRSVIYADIVLKPVLDPTGAVSGVFIQAIDVSAHRNTENELRSRYERLRLAIEGTGSGVWEWDIPNSTVDYSETWKSTVGTRMTEPQNVLEGWKQRIHPDDRVNAIAGIQDCLDGRIPSFDNEYRLLCKDDSWKWVMVRGTVVARDEKGAPLRMIGITTDISDKKESEQIIWQHANYDALTGLPNRRLFRELLEHEIKLAHRTKTQVGLLFIDLDHFKEVNDLFGHDAGDKLLAEAATRLKNCTRESDIVARLGGDEFTIILGALDDTAHIDRIAQEALDALNEPFHLSDEIVHLSGSIGITVYPADGILSEELLSNADQAMYAAKNAGHGQFRFFTRSMQEKASRRLLMIRDLRKALSAGQLEMRYQPVVDLFTGKIAKAEALLRWKHPKLGMVDPTQFIPLAEETGLINEIGDWVFKNAAEQSKRWSQQTGELFEVAVNRSPAQFLSKFEGIDWMTHLTEMGLSGANISIEITEGILLNASGKVAEKLMQYKDAGIQIAIDDFGTGYSSMAYLKKFDVDYLKIDQSFVRDMTTNPGNRTIVNSIIVMAHQLGINVIAEGIESREQKDLLSTSGCDYGQGFLFSEPLDAEAFDKMLLATVPHEPRNKHSKSTSENRLAELRRRAEKRLKKNHMSDHNLFNDVDAHRQVHELQVSQIELELQNMELIEFQQEHQAIEARLAHYINLFTFSPVPSFIIGREGILQEISLSGSRLLEVETQKLVGQLLAGFVAVKDRPAFNIFVAKVFTTYQQDTCEVSLITAGKKSFRAHIEASTDASHQRCFLAITAI